MTENKMRKEPVYSMKLKAGRKRTYFFDVRPTKSDDYYLTITESKKKFNEDRYERHKIFLYKEDFNKFMDVLNQSIDHCKNELMPEYNFDEFHREDDISEISQVEEFENNKNEFSIEEANTNDALIEENDALKW